MLSLPPQEWLLWGVVLLFALYVIGCGRFAWLEVTAYRR